MTFNVFVKNSTISVPPLACKLVSPMLESEAVKEEMSFREHVTYWVLSVIHFFDGGLMQENW